MSHQPADTHAHPVEVIVNDPYRYTVICWNEDCTDPIDTYGREEMIDIARDHVAEHGCELRVQTQAIIDVRPAAEAADLAAPARARFEQTVRELMTTMTVPEIQQEIDRINATVREENVARMMRDQRA